MSTLLKDIYSPEFYDHFSSVLEQILPHFDREQFIRLIFEPGFESKELKDRMKHTSKVLHQFLPEDYPQALVRLNEIIENLKENHAGEDRLVYLFFPDYIETYGLDHYEESVEAIAFVTQFISCEFAVRPFILKYGDQMLTKMEEWSLHESHKVRRLASEGSRPRLPWAMGIPFLKKDPSPILPILENLKCDPSLYVRKSVANNLNDIAKDHPQLVLDIAYRWSDQHADTDAIIKHGCRTLLKQGHEAILKHYGLSDQGISLRHFEILTPKVRIGESLSFRFEISNDHVEERKIRLEYAIYYLRQKGQHGKKVFKISERIYPAQTSVKILRKQKFVLITTRKFYTGDHQVALIINGSEKELHHFELLP